LEVASEPVLEEVGAQPLWMKKFLLWAVMQKNCAAAKGPNGIYCAWEGRNCGYTICPRRIFEEVGIDNTTAPLAKPPEKLRIQIKALQEEKTQLRETIDQLAKRVEILEKKG